MSDTKLFQPTNTDGIPTMDTQDITTSELHDKVKRNAEVDRLYTQYVEFMKKPVVLSYAEFREFEELYQQQALDDVNDPTSNKFQYYNTLLKKLFSRINPYKEYHVLMPNGEGVTFPPLLTPVSNVSNGRVESIDVFSNILDKCVDQPWKRKSATVQLLQAIYSSQNPALVKYQADKIARISDKMKETVNEGKVTTTTVETITGGTNVVDGMEFVLDD